MKKDQKMVGIYTEKDLTLVLIKDDLWRLIFTPLWEVDWSVISVICGVWKAIAIKLDDVWECVATLIHNLLGSVEIEGMTLLDLCQVIKSLALFGNMWQTTQLIWGSIEQVFSPACPGGGFRYMLSHVWVKKSQCCWIGLDLGLIFETVEQSHLQGEEQFVIELPLEGVWVLHPIRGSKQCLMDILTNILIEIWVQPSYMNGFFGLSSDLKGILVYGCELFSCKCHNFLEKHCATWHRVWSRPWNYIVRIL